MWGWRLGFRDNSDPSNSDGLVASGENIETLILPPLFVKHVFQPNFLFVRMMELIVVYKHLEMITEVPRS